MPDKMVEIRWHARGGQGAKTAATLVAAGLAADLKEGVRMSAEAIDSGQAAALLAKLRDFGAKHARP